MLKTLVSSLLLCPAKALAHRALALDPARGLSDEWLERWSATQDGDVGDRVFAALSEALADAVRLLALAGTLAAEEALGSSSAPPTCVALVETREAYALAPRLEHAAGDTGSASAGARAFLVDAALIDERAPAIARLIGGGTPELLARLREAARMPVSGMTGLIERSRQALADALASVAELDGSRPLIQLARETDVLIGAMEYCLSRRLRSDDEVALALVEPDSGTLSALDAEVAERLTTLRVLLEADRAVAGLAGVASIEPLVALARETRTALAARAQRLAPWKHDLEACAIAELRDAEALAARRRLARAAVDGTYGTELDTRRAQQDRTRLLVAHLSQDLDAALTQLRADVGRLRESPDDADDSSLSGPAQQLARAERATETGDLGVAIAAYEQFFALDLPVIDVARGFAAVLIAGRGRPEAHKALAELAKRHPNNPALATIFARSLGKRARRAAVLSELIERFPGYAPLHVEFIETLLTPGGMPGAVELDGVRASLSALVRLRASGTLGMSVLDPRYGRELLRHQPLWEAWIARHPSQTLTNVLRHEFTSVPTKEGLKVTITLALDLTLAEVEYRPSPDAPWTAIELEPLERTTAVAIDNAYPRQRYGLPPLMVDLMTLRARRGHVIWPADTLPTLEVRFRTRDGIASRPLPFARVHQEPTEDRLMRVRRGVFYLHPRYGLGTPIEDPDEPASTRLDEVVIRESAPPETHDVVMRFVPESPATTPGKPENAAGVVAPAGKRRRINAFTLLPGEIDLATGAYTRLRAGNLVDLERREYRVLKAALQRFAPQAGLVPLTALRIIANIGHPRYLGLLNRWLDHPSVPIRDQALRAHASILFREYRPDRVACALNHLAYSTDAEVQRALVAKLKGVDDPAVIPAFVLYLGRFPGLRRRLARFPFPVVREVLLAEAASPSLPRQGEFLAAAAVWLMSCGTPLGLPATVDLWLNALEAPEAERGAIARRLADFTGVNHGTNATAWRRWWLAARDSFVAPAPTPVPAQAPGRASATAPSPAGTVPPAVADLRDSVDTSTPTAGTPELLPSGTQRPTVSVDTALFLEAPGAREIIQASTETRILPPLPQRLDQPDRQTPSATEAPTRPQSSHTPPRALVRVDSVEIRCPKCGKRYVIHHAPEKLRRKRFRCKRCEAPIRLGELLDAQPATAEPATAESPPAGDPH